MSYSPRIDGMPAWRRPDSPEKTSEFTPPPAEELISVLPEPPKDRNHPEVYSDKDIAPKPTLDEPADAPKPPLKTATVAPHQLPGFHEKARDATDRLEAMRRDTDRTPGAPSIEHLVDKTQADFATMVLGAMQTELGRQQPADGTPRAPELNAPTHTPDELLERIKADPSKLHDLALQSAGRPAPPGSIREILQKADPRLELRQPAQETAADTKYLSAEEKAAMERERRRREAETENNFFENLLLKREAPEGEESEADMVRRMRKQTPDKGENYEEPKNPLTKAWGKAMEARDSMSKLALYDGPKGFRAQQRSEGAEEFKLRSVRVSYDTAMRLGKPEKALAIVRDHVNRMNDDFIQLQTRNASPEERFTQKARDQAYSLPGHEDRLRALMAHAWSVRYTEGRAQDADEGLANDYAVLVGMAQRTDQSGDFAATEDTAAFMAGDRPIRVVPKAVQMQATLAAIRIRNEHTYGSGDRNQLLEFASKELSALFEDPIDQRHAAWMARNPGATAQGELPPMTGEELQTRIEEAGTFYNLALSAGTTVAQEMLDGYVRTLTDQLDGEKARESLKASGGVEPRPANKYSEYDLEGMRALERKLADMAMTEGLERGGRPRLQTQQELRAIRVALAAREKDDDGRLGQEHKKFKEEAAKEFNEQHYTNDILIFNGSVETTDGESGALAVSLAAHGAERIDLVGNSKLGNATVRTLGTTAIQRVGASLPAGAYSLIGIEGRASSRIDPDILNQVKPNGLCVMSASLNPALAAQMAIRINPEWYKNSELPELVDKYLMNDSERRKLEMELRKQEYQNTIGSNRFAEDYHCALLPSTVCRFTATPGGIRVSQGHAKEMYGRPPEWTLVVCRNKSDGTTSNLYERIENFPDTMAA